MQGPYEHLLEQTITKAPYAVSGIAGVLTFFDNHSAGIVAMVAIITLGVNIYWQWRRNK